MPPVRVTLRLPEPIAEIVERQRRARGLSRNQYIGAAVALLAGYGESQEDMLLELRELRESLGDALQRIETIERRLGIRRR